MKAFRSYLILAVVVLAAPAVFAQTSAFDTATANANIIPAISITRTANLNFGDILQPGATGGTAVVTPGGVRNVSGVLGAGGTVNAAAFTVGGSGAKQFNIVVTPATLAISNGTTTMNVDTWTTSCVSPCTFPGAVATAQTLPLTVGGTLNVNAAQALGAYTGTFTVTVNYQ